MAKPESAPAAAGKAVSSAPASTTASRPGTSNPTMQHTLRSPARVSGVGLFSAAPVTITVHPAPADHGIVFRRIDLPGEPLVAARIENVVSAQRRTALQRGSASVETVEHLLSALAGMGIDNALVDVDAAELPVGDGSAGLFVDAIREAGVVEQGSARDVPAIGEAFIVQEGDASISYAPLDRPGLELVYALDFGGAGPIPSQTFSWRADAAAYAAQVAPARTFSTKAEAEAATAMGLFKHLTARDFLVIDQSGPIDNAYRFPDEPARHKLLDLLGDLSLAGVGLSGRFVAYRSGHSLNQKMAGAIAQRVRKGTVCSKLGSPSSPPGIKTMTTCEATCTNQTNGKSAATYTSAVPAMDIRKILTILPHRYPMVLVDRVIELDEGKRAVGLKNVTINEPFFVGHYPAAPIMPGVLIVEAMAQLAGLMLYKTLDHEGKVAVLMAMDEVRLRRPVTPGDQLVLEATSNKANSRLADVSCRALVGGEIAAEVRLKFMVVSPDLIGPGGSGGSKA